MQRKGIMTVAGVAAALAAGLAPATAGEAKQAVGEEIFIRYCAVCHGVDGAGNGPLADALKAVPPDLTTLAKRNGGRFPTDRVAETIHNGAAPGHGLGLLSVKAAVQMHRGRVVALVSPLGGACFRITLPLAPPA